VRLYRPLLDAGRAELRDWLRARGIPWVEDPTNEDIRFSRVKARAALAALSPLGITGERLAAAAGHLASAQEVLAAGVASAAARHVVRTAGALRVSPTLADEPMEVRRLLMMRAVHWLSGERYPPRSDDLARFSGAVLAGRAATLAGVRTKAGWMMREPRAVGQPVAVDRLWDRRWRVTGPPGEVRALGTGGLRQCRDWRLAGLPREVLAVTPGVWHGETLVSAPLAGWENGWSAQLDAPDHLFGLSD
jgi:tRNA(Ile)-lysidine synthase